MDTKTDKRSLLSVMWIFAVANYLYCDVMSHMDANILADILSGGPEGISLTPGFLLMASVMMEIPISAILLSRILPPGGSRIYSIVAGIIMTLVQIGSLYVGSKPTGYYLFFSVIEISTTVLIVIIAFQWKTREKAAM